MKLLEACFATEQENKLTMAIPKSIAVVVSEETICIIFKKVFSLSESDIVYTSESTVFCNHLYL
jgi:hypothetical protein